MLEIRIARECEAQQGRRQQEQREERHEPVVGDQRREVSAGVIDVLVDNR
jgi:hypothetical protein